MSESPPSLKLNAIPLYVYTAFCRFGHLSIDSSAVSSFWLLWMTLPWTWVCEYLSESLPSVLLPLFPEVGLLDRVMILNILRFWRRRRAGPHSGNLVLCPPRPRPHAVGHLPAWGSLMGVSIFVCSDQWCWASSIRSDHGCIFFREMSVRILCSAFNWVISFLGVELYGFLYMYPWY